MDHTGRKGPADYGASCEWCEFTRSVGTDEDDGILETIGRRFGRVTAQAAHDAIHDPMLVSIRDDHETVFPGEWWDGPDGDRDSPAIDKATLLSLIRLCNGMAAISGPGDGEDREGKSKTEWVRWRRCATLIRTAAGMDRGRARHGRAERYAAAVIIDPDPRSESNEGMDPDLRLDDFSILLECIAGTGGGWPQAHEETIHDHLPVLSRMLRDGATADEIRETVSILGAWDRSTLMELALGSGTDPDMDAVRTVLSLHRLESHPEKATGWYGIGDKGADWERWRAPVAKALAQAGIRHVEGTSIDPHGTRGKAALDRAAAMLTDALEQHGRTPFIEPAAYRDMHIIVSYAARSAIHDPDAMDMMCLMARTAETIKDCDDDPFFDPVAGYTRFDPIDPVFDRKGEGMRVLAEAAPMEDEGLPAAFITETMLAALGLART